MKIYKILLTTQAQESLLDISEYISLDSPERADIFIRELLESVKKILSIFPLS
jgi:plasmid stabilization system protein ParE